LVLSSIHTVLSFSGIGEFFIYFSFMT
jgi:hypothetical protein